MSILPSLICRGFNPDVVDEKKRDREIAKSLKESKVEDGKFLKLLLLGTGESGKSTIFKQIRQLYGEQFTQKQLNAHVASIFENVIAGITELMRGTEVLEIKLANPKLKDEWNSMKNQLIDDLTPQAKTLVQKIWADEGIQQVWLRRNEIQLLDTLPYFIENLDRLAAGKQGYKPAFNDWVHCRVRSAGIKSIRFKMYNACFEMWDVGGQRAERRKWVTLFDNVVTVIFVAAISEYDQDLFEAPKTNRLQESLDVWADIVNRQTFQDMGFVLFLNKFDIFMQKVMQKRFHDPLHPLLKDYNGPEPSELIKTESPNSPVVHDAIKRCASYIKDQYYKHVMPRIGYGTFTCEYTTAVNQNNMDDVFQSCQEHILKKSLFRNGFPLV